MRLQTFTTCALLCVALAACERKPPLNSSTENATPHSTCPKVGNKPGFHYCVVSFVELIAHPNRYSGQLVRVEGFAVRYNEEVYFYASLDSAEFAEKISGVRLVSGTKLPELQSILEEGVPTRFALSGVFYPRWHSENFSRLNPLSLGYLENVDEMGI
jgi:hypothetical protein